MVMPEPKVPFVDQVHEISKVQLKEPITDFRAWTLDTLDPDTTITYLSDDALDDVQALARFIEDNPLPLLLHDPGHVDIPALKAAMGMIGKRLREGPGFGVIDRLPLDDFDIETAKAIYWTMTRMIGRPVAQKWDGTMLNDVRDAGKRGYGVRRSVTNEELVFHTDNGFNLVLPDSVGLLCIHQAKEGGVSRFCSLYSMHNRLLEKYPRELDRLYQPVLFTRHAEHAEDEPKIMRAPVFHWDGNILSIRPNVNYIRQGYELAGLDVDPELDDALGVLGEVAEEPDLWVQMRMERGQLQFLNNRGVVHYRSAFTDFDEPERKRHLIRIWCREEGRPTYNG